MTQELEVGAMAFYHEKGFVPAYQQAARFSGEGGQIALDRRVQKYRK